MKKDVIFVVPFRNRPLDYKDFIENSIPFYESQKISFDILFAELDNIGDWNAGLCCNSVINLKTKYTYKYICIHHIDILPIFGTFFFPKENEFLIGYGDHGSFITEYKNFLDVNGYHNDIWGWGYEDDCIYRRATYKNYQIINSEDINNTVFGNRTHTRILFEENEKHNLKILEDEYEKYVNGFDMVDNGIFNFFEQAETHSEIKLADNIYKHKIRPFHKSQRELTNNNRYKIL